MSSPLLNISYPTEQVGSLTLKRPEKRNALSTAMLKELIFQVRAFEKDPNIRILLINGEGPAFCSGLDLEELRDQKLTEKLTKTLATFFSTLYATSLITICAVQGAVYAGGAGLMSACDFVIAAENTHICYPEVRLGLVPAQVMLFLIQQLKQRDVLELLLLGERIDAKKAKTIGLINSVVPLEQLQQEALQLAKSLLDGELEALCQTKKFFKEITLQSFAQDQAKALQIFFESRNSFDSKKQVWDTLHKKKI